jgi:hypothetical protein
MSILTPVLLYVHFKITYFRLLSTTLQPERHNDTDVLSLPSFFV